MEIYNEPSYAYQLGAFIAGVARFLLRV